MDVNQLAAALKGSTSGDSAESSTALVPVKFDLGGVTIRGYKQVSASMPDDFLEEVGKLAEAGWPIDTWEKKSNYSRNSWNQGGNGGNWQGNNSRNYGRRY